MTKLRTQGDAAQLTVLRTSLQGSKRRGAPKAGQTQVCSQLPWIQPPGPLLNNCVIQARYLTSLVFQPPASEMKAGLLKFWTHVGQHEPGAAVTRQTPSPPVSRSLFRDSPASPSPPQAGTPLVGVAWFRAVCASIQFTQRALCRLVLLLAFMSHRAPCSRSIRVALGSSCPSL